MQVVTSTNYTRIINKDILGMVRESSFINYNFMKSFLLYILSFFVINSAFAQNSDEISATINKNTSQEQLNELQKFFKESDLNLDLQKVNYNSNNEIIGLVFRLTKENQQASFSMQTNQPISEIHLGYKNNQVFIDSNNGFGGLGDQISLNELFEQFSNTPDLDELLSENPFEFSFNSSDLQKMLSEDDMSIENMMQGFMEQFNFSTATNQPQSNLNQFNFIDNPDLDTLVIIDGKESNFNTLQSLAKQNKIADVDRLKASTAISVYGKKAKDGAIIVTTKK